MNKKTKIYLCDLTYDTIVLVTDTIPINVGYIGSYLDKNLKDQLEIKLFKYPNELLDELKNDPPDILGLSNYSWNSNLSEMFARIGKKINPNLMVIQGGTNIPHEIEEKKKFLINRPSTDVYAMFEGERSALNFVNRFIETRNNPKTFFDNPIDGCVFIHPDTRGQEDPKFVVGKYLERIKDLDEIPSPYLNGMLDKFFDGRLRPFIETNRGCPFTCSFCHTGHDYFHKINKFSAARVQNEIEYIGQRCEKKGIQHLHLADLNFGMYPQDKLVCEYLLESKKKYNWPQQIMATTGKNNKKRVSEITSILGDMFSVNMSLQSMNMDTLKNIKRANIRQEDIIAVNKHLRAAGRSTKAELIVPLPGETKESFIEGLDIVLEANASTVTIYTLMMLYGTDFKNPKYRKDWGYVGKFRIIPLNFGEYNGEKTFDFEEVGIATKDLSYEDYLYVRSIALMVESLHNGRPFNEFFVYAKQYGIKPGIFLKTLLDNIELSGPKVRKVFKDFIEETKSELWDTEEALVSHYNQEKNYKLLREGKVGGNLIYKYKSLSLTEAKHEWLDFFESELLKLLTIQGKVTDFTKCKNELSNIKNFCAGKLAGLFLPGENTSSETNFDYDIVSWIDDNFENDLSDYRIKGKIQFNFSFTKDQESTRDHLFSKYGKNINGLSKILTRISNLESLYRKINSKNNLDVRDIYKVSSETFTKYSLSN